MKISAIEFIALSVPLGAGKAYGMSKSLAGGRQSTLVRMTLEDGTHGYGEAWGMPAVNKAYLPFLADYLEGSDVFDVEHVYGRILARHYHFGVQNGMMHAISGIDMAAKDAQGKLLGLPVSKLLGGQRQASVPIYASGGYLTETPEEDYRPQIERMAEAGHRAIKIKIGLNPESDEMRVRLARELLGPDVEIYADINTNYTCDIALESMKRLEPYGLGWLEEPLSPQDFDGYSRLRARATMPIATGEALYTVHDFKRLVDCGGADVLQPDLSLCGGFWQGRKIAELAQVNHLRLSPHVWGGAVGLAAALHFISSLAVFPHADNIPKPVLLEYDLGENPLRTQLLKTSLDVVDGRISVPEGPGLGIEINEEALSRYAVS
ncbi:mandelate racemase/muconate lactonizing enzyme family protein [Mariluticola halotolerans]|uniref:mandelate racemase/muconate lactonizing enzyme family protein n=1 Tax=Mariluticola halotolerans TaxID=2909283 RepID=UPI0026E43751|nr:mandelate racemase/muconate lactonizing enzyme family protein [Mariluticola halotolerans]UJQ94253.1 mandelate racemase/muconate lactonizing enzyme family protein [Mariluticola halotolerans]